MDQPSVNILMLSIIDPMVHRGGAGSVTRGLLKALSLPPLNARVDYIYPTNPFLKNHQAKQFFSIAKSIISPLPSKVIFTYSKKLLKDVKRSLESKVYDLVLINGSDLLWLLSYLPPNLPKILIAHNIEHQLFRAQINSSKLPSFLLPILEKDCKCLESFELSGIELSKNVVCLSNSEEKFIRVHCPGTNTVVVPPLFDYSVVDRNERSISGDTLYLSFLANFSWWPNQQGLRWFLDYVFPHVSKNVVLNIFGEKSEELPITDARVIKHGFVKDIQQVWQVTDLAICPIFAGGGVNVKFAEAIYNRVPILATSFAARGLNLFNDPSITFLEKEIDWINFIHGCNPKHIRESSISTLNASQFSFQNQLATLQEFFNGVAPL